jgi:hypothetical protein
MKKYFLSNKCTLIYGHSILVNDQHYIAYINAGELHSLIPETLASFMKTSLLRYIAFR